MPIRLAQKSVHSKKNASKARSKTRMRLKRVLGRYAVVALLFAFSLTGLIGYFSYKKLTAPFVSASSLQTYNIESENVFALSVIFVEDLNTTPILIKNTNVIFFDVKNKKVLNYSFDKDLELDIAGKYSYEPLSKILGFGMMLNDTNFNSDLNAGIEMTNKTLENVFAYPIHRYIVVDARLEQEFMSYFANKNSLRVGFDFLNKLNGAINTNLNFNEANYVYKTFNQASANNFKLINVSQDRVTSSEVLDANLYELVFDSKIAAEKKSVAVLNGTKLPGLAGFGSRVVKNMGGRVIAVGNSSKTYEESILIVDDLESETVKALVGFFNIKNVLHKDNAGYLLESEISRSDITVIVGFDIAGSL